MGWLTSAEIAAMIGIESNVLPDTCVISQPGTVSDGAGGNTVTYTPVTGGTVSCRFDPKPSNQVQVFAGAEGYVFDYIVTLPYNAPMAGDYRITHNTNTYEIVTFHNDKSWQLCTKAFVAEVEV